MYPQYNCLNVPTWIIGPALGEGLLIDRPADVLKVWPTREPIQRLPPSQFSPLLDQLARVIAESVPKRTLKGCWKVLADQDSRYADQGSPQLFGSWNGKQSR